MQQARWIRHVVVAGALAASLPLSAQAPLPLAGASDGAALLQEVRRRLQLDADFQSGYVYLQRETEVKLDGEGRETSRSVREYEVYPSVGDKPGYKRLVARDGMPTPAAALAESDRRRGADEAEGRRDRDKRRRHAAEERRERQALMDEIFRLFEFRVAGRETLAGRPSLLVGFTPRQGMTASTRAASVAQKFVGTAWVDQQDLQVVRVEARSTEDVKYGFGVFARIFKGTTVFWERRKVDGDAWMPARLEIRADARVMLFRRLGLHRVTDYLNYRRVPDAPLPR